MGWKSARMLLSERHLSLCIQTVCCRFGGSCRHLWRLLSGKETANERKKEKKQRVWLLDEHGDRLGWDAERWLCSTSPRSSCSPGMANKAVGLAWTLAKIDSSGLDEMRRRRHDHLLLSAALEIRAMLGVQQLVPVLASWMRYPVS
jgi:hypothetical protein